MPRGDGEAVGDPGGPKLGGKRLKTDLSAGARGSHPVSTSCLSSLHFLSLQSVDKPWRRKRRKYTGLNQLDEQVKCLNNVTTAQLKLELSGEALRSSEEAFIWDSCSVAALFRKGKLLSEYGDILLALAALKSTLKLEPTNKAIHPSGTVQTDDTAAQCNSRELGSDEVLGCLDPNSKITLLPNLKTLSLTVFSPAQGHYA